MTKIIKAKDHADSFADVYVLTGIKVGEGEYCKITFCRHIVETTALPDMENPTPVQNFYLEAIQSVTLPMSMAKNLAKDILEAPTMDPNLVTPMKMKL
ncbi:hypothetical protein ABMZ76_00355 [Morganella morganii]|uniref:hypothetical protein n=1 Tax=Morganella morganii TaxID=582 RepID=UPI0031B5F570